MFSKLGSIAINHYWIHIAFFLQVLSEILKRYVLPIMAINNTEK